MARISSSLKHFAAVFAASVEPLFVSLSELASQAISETDHYCFAPFQSGALITAKWALEQGRDVFAVPGSIFTEESAGVNKLIQDGAHLVTNIKDILQTLNLFTVAEIVEAQAALPDNDEERILLALLSHDPLHVDELIRESDLPTEKVTSTLMAMELKGMIRQLGSMQFVLAR